MVFAVPQYQVSFVSPDKYNGDRSIRWIVNGESELDALCKILRWNGILSYSVAEFDATKDESGL